MGLQEPLKARRLREARKRAGNYEARSKIEMFLPKNRQIKLKTAHQREECSTNEQSHEKGSIVYAQIGIFCWYGQPPVSETLSGYRKRLSDPFSGPPASLICPG